MRRKTLFLVTLAFLLAVMLAGCAGGYGNLREVDKGEMAVDTLVSNYQNYNVYYLGDFSIPYAVLFDPKEDGKTVKVGDRWEKVPTQDTASKQVGQISTLIGRGVNMPRLWKLVGTDGSVFGYVYTTAVQLSTNVVDGNTMFVGNN